MKTYPFVQILIRLLTMLLVVLTGWLATLVFEPLLTDSTATTALITTVPIAEKSRVPPELLTTITTGKKLFKTNCANCHNRDMKSDMTGPALAGVTARWAAYSITDLYDWVKNSTQLIETGHPKAVAIYDEWRRSPMTPFHNLTDEDVAAILTYVESVE